MTVDLGGSANTILTVMADDDPALDDGMTATATLTIESANGADIGARNSLAVTVSGVTQETDPEPEPEDLVVTLSADPMEIEAGGMSTITATANRAVTADDGAVKIDLTVEGDGTLDAESITIAMGEMSGSVMLTANESVTVEATGSGISDEPAGHGDRGGGGAGAGRPGGHAERRSHGDRGGRHVDDHRDGQPSRHG